MYKKLLAAALAAIFVFAILPAAALHANDNIAVTINGVPVNFTDQTPVIVDNRTLVPVADVFRTLGFTVDWDDELWQVTLTKNEYRIDIIIDSKTFFVNNAPHTLDVPAQIINSRTMLPIRLVLESVGYEVDWDAAASIVLITYEAEIAQSRMGMWDEITIIGDADFTRRTQEAIDLIKTGAPDLYEEILHYLGIVRQYYYSGMWFWLDPPEFRVGTPSYTASVIWYASIIIHDAIHSRQAYENPRTFDDIHSQLWHDAEMEALEYQIKFFRLIDAPQSYINHIEHVRDNPWWLGDVTW